MLAVVAVTLEVAVLVHIIEILERLLWACGLLLESLLVVIPATSEEC